MKYRSRPCKAHLNQEEPPFVFKQHF